MTAATLLSRAAEIQARFERAIAAHFDPRLGSAFWLDRAARLGIDPACDLRTPEDLKRFGPLAPAELRARPLPDYIPRRFHGRLDRFVLGQTGGTTGRGTWTAYRDDEFQEAFVLPFVAAAAHLGFPRREPWLFVGPSGPHLIGKVVRHIAAAMGSPDPFSVDFDPRWVRKLPAESLARRYLGHILEQAMDVIDHQQVGALFTTPPVLERLAERMSEPQRLRIRGIHYGGMAIGAEQMRRFQTEAFPDAVHLSGYGNTLMGCCLELDTSAGRQIDYYPHGHRLLLEVVDANGSAVPLGANGRVRLTRLDESFLIINLVERDEAIALPPPSRAPAGFVLSGVRDPHPAPTCEAPVATGLY